jgi:hypothetical protein
MIVLILVVSRLAYASFKFIVSSLLLNGFEETASLNEQLRDTETGGEVFGAGLEHVIDTASSMANRAGYVAVFAMPPKLLSENQ